uniref:Uncharacterized protein n=1 Tax=Rhizophora mucronata TaxID=61149 RepID=A0A2P2JCV0_RHIMU
MTIRKIFAKAIFGDRRLLPDISEDTHWTSSFTKKGHVSEWGRSLGLSLVVSCAMYLQNCTDSPPSNHVLKSFTPSSRALALSEESFVTIS